MNADGENSFLIRKLYVVKEKVKDDPYLRAFFDDLEREIVENKETKKMQEMIRSLFEERLMMDNKQYINF